MSSRFGPVCAEDGCTFPAEKKTGYCRRHEMLAEMFNRDLPEQPAPELIADSGKSCSAFLAPAGDCIMFVLKSGKPFDEEDVDMMIAALQWHRKSKRRAS